MFVYFSFVLQVQSMGRFSCLQAGEDPKSMGTNYIKSFTRLIKESLKEDPVVDNPIPSFPKISRVKTTKRPIYIYYDDGKILIDCGNIYMFFAVDYVPDFLDKTKSFPALHMDEISQIFSEDVTPHLQEALGQNILQLFENALNIKKKEDRIKVYRTHYVIKKSSWIHFLLKGPKASKKVMGHQLYFCSGLKAEVIPGISIDYDEPLDNYIKILLKQQPLISLEASLRIEAHDDDASTTPAFVTSSTASTIPAPAAAPAIRRGIHHNLNSSTV